MLSGDSEVTKAFPQKLVHYVFPVFSKSISGLQYGAQAVLWLFLFMIYFLAKLSGTFSSSQPIPSQDQYQIRCIVCQFRLIFPFLRVVILIEKKHKKQEFGLKVSIQGLRVQKVFNKKPHIKNRKMIPKVSFEIKDHLTKDLHLNPVHRMEDWSADQFAVINQSFVLRVNFDQSVPKNKCYCGVETKLLLFEMDDPPTISLLFRKYDEKDVLQKVKIYVSSSEISICRNIKTQVIKQQLLTTVNWYNQNEMFLIEYKEKKSSFKIYLRTVMNGTQVGGFLGQSTQIQFHKELHQQFNLVEDEKFSSGTVEPSSDDEIDFFYEIKKLIGGHDRHLELIQKYIFNTRMLDSNIVKMLNLKHIKGILLFGPPGTGKTAIARQMAKFSSLPVTIINGPQIMDKYVGESERKIREPFEVAQKDQAQKGDNSPVHVIIIDEIDAICKKRGTNSTNVYDSIVNQLLTCIDGVMSLNNVLIIAMTNRKDMLDPAILRPGRIEVHIQICLPNLQGRLEILNIHTRQHRKNGIIHQSVDLKEITRLTQNYTGAQIQALVRNTFNLALADWKKDNFLNQDLGKRHFMCQQHFDKALKDFVPQFGADTSLIEAKMPKYKIPSQNIFSEVIEEIEMIKNQIKQSDEGKYTILLSGDKKTGKTVLACEMAKAISFQFTKLMNVDKMVGLSENGKLDKIYEVYFDSLKCDNSVIIFDDIIDLIEYVSLDKHYSKIILQAFIQIFKKSPEKGKKTVIIVTESRKKLLKQLGLYSSINFKLQLPMLTRDKIMSILEEREYNKEQIGKVTSAFESLSMGEMVDLIESTCKHKSSLEKYCKILKLRREHEEEL